MSVRAGEKYDLVIVELDKARTALAQAKTIQDTKRVLDMAAAAEIYARRQQLSQDSIDYAHTIKIEALAQLGRMLQEGQKATGNAGTARGRDVSGGIRLTPPEKAAPTLSDLGLDKKTSSLSQKLASLPRDQFEQVKTGEVSVTQATRKVRAEQIAKRVSLPDAKYRVIYADPPWSYGNTQPDYHTEQRDHYPVMPLADICAMPVAALCEPDSVLFLWVTSPILEESFQVIKAWGFRYKASFVWDKVLHNMGHYNSVRHEFLLIATRGSGVPEVAKLFDSVVSQERTKHSQKPEIFYEIIETLYPSGKRIELFSRSPRDGWDAYGYEAAACAA